MSTHLKDVVEVSLAGITLTMAWLNILSVVLTIIATALTILWSGIKISESQWWKRQRRKWSRK